MTGIAEKAIRQAAEWWGTAKSSFLLHARGIEHQSHGVQNVLGAINIVLASGRIGREGCGYATITGQANGQGGREHGQKCDQLPGGRDLANPEHRAHVAKVWGVDPAELPQPGVDAYEIFRKIDRGEIHGLLSICFNPMVSLPDNNFVARMLEKLEFYVAIDFFLNDTARHADIVLPGSLQEEDEGTVTQIEGRVIKINKAVDPPGDARQDWRIIQDIAKALGRPHGFTFREPREIFDELRRASQGGIADYSGITYEKIEQQFGVFWPCPSDDHPGTPRLFEPGSWNPDRARRRALLLPRRQSAVQRRRVRSARGRRRCRISRDPDHRSGRQPVSLRHANAPHWSARRSVSRAARRDSPAVGKAACDFRRRVDDRRESSRKGHAAGAVGTTIRPDTVFIPYHWAGPKSINQLTISAQDPISKIPEYKVCAVRIRPAEGEPEYARQLEPQQ